MSSIEERMISIVADRLSVDPAQVVPGARLVEDLGADSLDLVELTMTLEEAFALTVEDDQTDQLRTVADLIRFVQDAHAASAPA